MKLDMEAMNEQHQTSKSYPKDPTGDALRSIAESGSDMNEPMEIEFHIFVGDKTSGDAIVKAVESEGFEADLWCDEDTEDWTCTCYKSMLATYDGITKTEELLSEVCSPFGGEPDGWGTFGNSDVDLAVGEIEEHLFGYDDEGDDEGLGENDSPEPQV